MRDGDGHELTAKSSGKMSIRDAIHQIGASADTADAKSLPATREALRGGDH